jgi:hypothetical protein
MRSSQLNIHLLGLGSRLTLEDLLPPGAEVKGYPGRLEEQLDPNLADLKVASWMSPEIIIGPDLYGELQQLRAVPNDPPIVLSISLEARKSSRHDIPENKATVGPSNLIHKYT